jgi:hypothetical protein
VPATVQEYSLPFGLGVPSPYQSLSLRLSFSEQFRGFEFPTSYSYQISFCRFCSKLRPRIERAANVGTAYREFKVSFRLLAESAPFFDHHHNVLAVRRREAVDPLRPFLENHVRERDFFFLGWFAL